MNKIFSKAFHLIRIITREFSFFISIKTRFLSFDWKKDMGLVNEANKKIENEFVIKH